MKNRSSIFFLFLIFSCGVAKIHANDSRVPTKEFFRGGVLHITQNENYEKRPLDPSKINTEGSSIHNSLVLGKQEISGKIVYNGKECNYFIAREQNAPNEERSAPLVGIAPLINKSLTKANHAGYSIYGDQQNLNNSYFGIEIDGVWDRVATLSQIRTLRKLLIALRIGHLPDPEDVDFKISEYEAVESQYIEKNRAYGENRQIRQFRVLNDEIDEEFIFGHYACAVNPNKAMLGRKLCGKELTTPLTRLLLGMNVLRDHPNLDKKQGACLSGPEVCIVNRDNEQISKGILTTDLQCAISCCKSYEEFGAKLSQEICNKNIDLDRFRLPQITLSNWRDLYDQSDATFNELVATIDEINPHILNEYRGREKNEVIERSYKVYKMNSNKQTLWSFCYDVIGINLNKIDVNDVRKFQVSYKNEKQETLVLSPENVRTGNLPKNAIIEIRVDSSILE